MPTLPGAVHRQGQVSPVCRAGGGWGDGREFSKPTAERERGWGHRLVHQNPARWNHRPPWSTSEVSLGQIKDSVLHPAGEGPDGTHYPKMWSGPGI